MKVLDGLQIKLMDYTLINISNYEPLSGRSYIPLPKKLINSMKGLINLKNKDHVLCGVMLDLLILQIAIQEE